MDSATAKHVGARLLGEVEEGSLEEVCTHALFLFCDVYKCIED